MQKRILTLEDIQKAHNCIEKIVKHTPVLSSDYINNRFGSKLYFKCENLQTTGSFKFRGASNAISELCVSNPDVKKVVTHSSGNHGAALACAAQQHGLSATIVMPKTAPKTKQDNVKQYNGNIVFCEPTMESRQSNVQRILDETGAELIHPFNDYRIMAGQGTAALELLTLHPGLNLVLTPVGGGGLLSGSATAAKGLNPNIAVMGVEPEIANDQYLSFHAKKRIGINDPKTIADGLRTTMPGEKPFATILEFVDDIVTVSEESIKMAMRVIWEHLKIVVEPSGAVPLAALIDGKIDVKYQHIGIILSGGNLDLDTWKW